MHCASELESRGCHGDSEVRKEKGGRGIDTYTHTHTERHTHIKAHTHKLQQIKFVFHKNTDLSHLR